MKIKIQRIRPDAIMPKYAHKGDAGFDIFSPEEYLIKPGERVLVKTRFRVEILSGYEMQIRPKSGLAINKGVSVLNTPGTVDAGYRGEVCVILINQSKKDYIVEKRSKVAQGVINKIKEVVLEEVDELSETFRGQGGFGSTGLE